MFTQTLCLSFSVVQYFPRLGRNVTAAPRCVERGVTSGSFSRTERRRLLRTPWDCSRAWRNPENKLVYDQYLWSGVPFGLQRWIQVFLLLRACTSFLFVWALEPLRLFSSPPAFWLKSGGWCLVSRHIFYFVIFWIWHYKTENNLKKYCLCFFIFYVFTFVCVFLFLLLLWIYKVIWKSVFLVGETRAVG